MRNEKLMYLPPRFPKKVVSKSVNRILLEFVNNALTFHNIFGISALGINFSSNIFIKTIV